MKRYSLAIVLVLAIIHVSGASDGLAARPTLAAGSDPSGGVSRGEALYLAHCAICHGPTAIGYYMIPIPDLRRSDPAIIAQMQSIVLDGALASAGMPSFKGRLTTKDIRPLQAYIAKRRLQMMQN